MKRIFLSLGASALESLRQTVWSFRFLVASILIGVIMILGAWMLADAAWQAAQIDPPPISIIWIKGAEGAFVSLAYWFVPLLFPLLPLAIAYDALKRDRATGYLETAMSKPVPRWGIASGRVLGIFAAIAVPVVAVSFASALIIQSVVGEPISTTLVIGFLGSALILVATFLGLVLLLGTRLTSSIVSGFTLIAWVAFNAISPTPFILLGQFTAIIPLAEDQTFQLATTDLASVTGVYQGLVSAYVPEALAYVIPSSVPYWGVAVAGSAWLVVALVLYVWLLSRYPLG